MPRHSSSPQQTLARAVAYDDMAVSQLLFKYLWPFWMFKDASRGDRLARAAAYRYNRGMRIYLPSYLARWSVNCAVWLAVVSLFSAADRGQVLMLDLLAAASGIVFACAFCVLVVTTYIYIYLSRVAD